MANEKPAKPAEAPAAPAEAPKKNSMKKMVILAALVMVLEGGTVGVTMMMSSGPKKAMAEAPVKVVEPPVKDVEVKLLAESFPNNVSGRMYMYDLQVVAKVDEKNKARATELFAERDAETRDRIRTIIASSDPKILGEPELETLRRQISYQLEQDFGKEGKDLIKDILIPKCTGRLVQQY